MAEIFPQLSYFCHQLAEPKSVTLRIWRQRGRKSPAGHMIGAERRPRGAITRGAALGPHRMVKGGKRRARLCGSLQDTQREMAAGERKGSALAIEFKAVVSPEWLAEVGDPRPGFGRRAVERSYCRDAAVQALFDRSRW